MRKLLTFLTLLTLVWVTGHAADQTVTFDFTTGYTNNQKVTGVSDDASGVSLAFAKGSNTSEPTWYDNGTALRVYGSNKITATIDNGSKVIKQMTFTFASASNTLNSTATSTVDTGTYTESGATGTWTGSATSIVITRGGTNGNARIQQIVVTYGDEEAGGDETTYTTYNRVIKTAEIIPGNKYIVVADGGTKAMGPIVSGYHSGVAVTPSSDQSTVSVPDGAGVRVITLLGTEGAYLLKTDQDKYLYQSSITDDKISEFNGEPYSDQKAKVTITGTQADPKATIYLNQTNYYKIYLSGSGNFLASSSATNVYLYGAQDNISQPTAPAAPTFSPSAGGYVGTQTVTISAAEGCDIYYTLSDDGSTPADPTTASTPYTGPLTVSTTTTIKAIAVKSVSNSETTLSASSSVASATYTITPAIVPDAPTFSPAGGTYSETQTVTLSCATAGSTIYYTTDGSEPTDQSTRYSSPITVSVTTTIKAVAKSTTGTLGDVATATYTIGRFYDLVTKADDLQVGGEYIIVANTTDNGTPIAMGAVSSSSGSKQTGLTISGDVATLTSGSGVMPYTLGGSEGQWVITDSDGKVVANASSTSLSAATTNTSTWSITIDENNLAKLTDNSQPTRQIIYRTSTYNYFRGYASTAINNTEYYGVRLYKRQGTGILVETPVISPAAGEYDAGTVISVTCATAGATIHYTTDGSEPTTSSTVYSGSITLNSAFTLKAIAVDGQGNLSRVASAAYTVKAVETGDGLYHLVTNAADLHNGDRILIVNAAAEGSANAMSTTQNTSNRGVTAVTIVADGSDFTIDPSGNSDVQVITLEGSAGAWTFNVGSAGYLYAAGGTSSNSLKSQTPAGEHAVATIIIDTGHAATITFAGEDSGDKAFRGTMRYNPNNSNPMFSCYVSTSTTGNLPYIYRLVEAVQPETYDVVQGTAAFKAVSDGEVVCLKLVDTDMNTTRVLAVDGDDVFVRDADGALVLTGILPSREVAYNQHLAGTIVGQRATTADGLPQLLGVSGKTNTAHLVIADPVTEPVTEPVAIAAADRAAHLADWVTITDLSANGINLSDRFNLGYTAPYNGAVIDLDAIVAGSNTYYPLANGLDAALTYVVDINQDFTAPSSNLSGVPVRLTRPMSAGHWTVVTLPFDLGEDALDGTIMEYTGLVQGDAVTTMQGDFAHGIMTFTEVSSMQAGRPYLVKPESDITTIAVPSTTLAAGDPQTITFAYAGAGGASGALRRATALTAGDEYSLVGVYSSASVASDNTQARYVLSADGTSLEEGGDVAGTQGYVAVPAGHVPTLDLGEGEQDKPTAVTTVKADSLRPTVIYNIMGVEMRQPWADLPSGVYIVNGKKVVK